MITEREFYEIAKDTPELMRAYYKAVFAIVEVRKEEAKNKSGLWAEMRLKKKQYDATFLTFQVADGFRFNGRPLSEEEKIQVHSWIAHAASFHMLSKEEQGELLTRIGEAAAEARKHEGGPHMKTSSGLARSVDWFALQNPEGERLTFIAGDRQITIMRKGAPAKVTTRDDFDPTKIGATIKLRNNKTGREDTWTVDRASINEIISANGTDNPWTIYDAILTAADRDQLDVVTLIVNGKARAAIHDPDQSIPWRSVRDLLKEYVVPARQPQPRFDNMPLPEPFAIEDAPPGWLTASRRIGRSDDELKAELGLLCGMFWRKECRVGLVLDRGPVFPMHRPADFRGD
jgi:hypothetical protein